MKTSCTLAVLLLVCTAVFSQSQNKKYDVKSGIVNYDITIKVGTVEMKTKTIVYFDDYGMKECKETYYDGKLTDSYFSDGKQLYSLHHSKKQAFNRGTAYRGTELRVEWTEFGDADSRAKGGCKQLSAITVAGKSCDAFECNDGKGTIARYVGWKHVLMLLYVKDKNTETTQQATKIEENAKVPADKFVVPAGYKLQ